MPTTARTRRACRIILSAALIPILLTAGPIPSAQAGTTPTLPHPDSNGLSLDNWRAVPGRPTMYDATVRTDAVFDPNQPGSPGRLPLNIRIHLPADYSPANGPYPVLYLLHGGAGTWEQWSNDGQLVDTLDGTGYNGIVVMPEGGRTGWYTDWHGTTDGGFAPAWETFHIDQVVPWVDANFATIDSRDGRGVAGVSMGGLGALMYAGRHSDLFGAAASFSGGTDLTEPEAQNIVSDTMWRAGAAVDLHGILDGNYRVNLPWWTFPSEPQQRAHRMETVFGPSSTWSNVNPYQMAASYDAYDGNLFLYSGQGRPGDDGELHLGQWNTAFSQRLDTLNVGHRYCTGPGSHTWFSGEWQNDLHHFVRNTFGNHTGPACPNNWTTPS